MGRATRSALLAVLVALLGGFLFFLGYTLLFAPQAALLPQFRAAWVLRRATIGLVENVVPLVVAALAITYSILINPESLASESTVVTNAFDNLRGPLIVLTLLAMAYTAVLGLVTDGLESDTGGLEALSESAVTYRDEATDALRRGEVDQGLRFLRLYQSIAGRNARLADAEGGGAVTVSGLIADVEARRAEGRERGGQGMASEPNLMREGAPMTPEENTRRAMTFLEAGDYVNAHFYARRALDVRPGWEAPLRVLNEARRNLDRPGEEALEGPQRQIFEIKREGLEAWQAAEVNVEEGYRALNRGKVIEAFVIFRRLRQDIPEDPDVQFYYNEARRALQNQALSLSEMTTNRSLPGSKNILYAGYWEGMRGLVKIGSLVAGSTASYAYDVEFVRFDDDGRILEHVRAEAGKLIDTTLYFRLIDEEPEQAIIGTTAQWIIGEEPEGEPLLVLDYGARDLMLFASSSDGEPVRGIAAQLEMMRRGEEAGHHLRPVAADVALQFVQPFALIVLAIAAIGFGWSHRSRYLRRPFILLAPAIVIAPFVAKVVYELYMEAHRSIVLLLLATLQLSTTLLVLTIVELALLFGAIFYLAREVNQSAA